MKIFVNRLGKQVILDLPDNQNEFSDIKYSGDTDLTNRLKADLSKSYGIFGHIIDPEQSTGLDIWFALNQMKDLMITSNKPIVSCEMSDGFVS